MSRAWFLQANPKLYDIDGALLALGEIWWRVPQYTTEVKANDVAVMWRSGPGAGIVGVGRIATDPQMHPTDPAEMPFFRTTDYDADGVTQVLVRVRPVELIGKDELRSMKGFEQHQIVVAPMGTVFPIAEAQWSVLSARLPAIPAAMSEAPPDLPRAFAWEQRAKGVAPMPGGYDGYLRSVATVCDTVAQDRPSIRELPSRLEELLGVTPSGASQRASFLRKIDVIEERSGVCHVGSWASRWRETGDPRLIVALVHSRCRFIGELLAELRTPRTSAELRDIAGERYGLGWDTLTQIDNRRGWLQSAGMLTADRGGTMQLTGAGLALLAELSIHQPLPQAGRAAPAEPVTTPVARTPAAVEPSDVTEAPAVRGTVDRLVDELRASAVDSSNPDRFEQATRDAFAFLGFDAQWLGGSGRTDVMLDARLGRDDRYRVIVDCKTSGSGKVGDQQVDWVTLAEHRTKHDAHHVALVAPNPSGERLITRAQQQEVTVISVEQLVGLCRQHAKTAVGLDDYRSIFEHGGEVDTQHVDERAEEVERLLVLALAVCRVIREQSQDFGRFSARDTLLTLRGDPVAETTTEDELQILLDTLASPLLGVLHGTRETGYRITTSPEVFELRLNALATALSGRTIEDAHPTSVP
jgi:hypothetical protein